MGAIPKNVLREIIKENDFKNPAKIIGVGKPMAKSIALITSVFLRTIKKSGEVKNISNHFKPAQGLPIIPLLKL